MKVKLYLSTLLLLLCAFVAHAQQEVRFGAHRFTPPANTDALYGGTRGSSAKASNQHMLVQFSKLPTASERKRLADNGIVLGEYYGSNTFMTTVNAQKVQRSPRSRNIVAAFEMQPEWKVSSMIANNRVPDYAKAGIDELLVQVHYASSMPEADVRAKLAELGLKYQHIAADFGIVYMQLRKEAVNQLAQQNWVKSIGLQAAPEDLYNRGGRSLIKADVLGLPNDLRGRGLTGKGVKVGIWDSNVEKHADYGKRMHQQEFESTVISSGGHGMHVAGTVAGAGLLDPTAMGMAPEADIYTYNFNVQSNNKRAYQEMLEAHKQFGISITQNSYGVYLSNVCQFVDQLSYNSTSDAWALDNLVSMNPNLLLVFAAGNDQGACGLDYLSSTNRQKNVLHVGAVNEQGSMSSFSSWGPMDDGRLLPTVCAKGVDVWSTLPGDSYGPMDGTSMACPGASGLMALLIERYRQINGGQEPLAALLKAVAANAADDYGRPGPDYQYGFGVLNGDRAAETMEKGWYRIGSIGEGEADMQYTINVPAGSKQLRVMLAWTDTVGKVEYEYGEPALINDLDLTVGTLQPWILDKDNPTAVAVRGRDTINNMEQVTIDNPSGSYTINVKASAVVSDKQQFVVAYYIERGDFEMVSPAGGELYAPGENITLRWYNAGAPLSFEISYDGGQTYEYLGALSQPNYSVSLSLPADAPATNKAKIRVSANGKRATSGMFTIMGVPEVQLASNACDLSAWKLDWTPVAGATEYEVLKANEVEGTYSVIATVNGTTHTLVNEQISIDERNIYAVRAKAGEVVGRRSLGQLAPNQPAQPITAAQLPFVEDFKIYPSRYFSTQVSPQLSLTYAETSMLGIVDPDNLDSHVLYLKGGYSGQGQMILSMCGLDLKSIPTTSKVMLSYKVVGAYGSDPSENISALSVDGMQNWLENMSGVTYNVPLSADENEWRTVAYDLSSYIGQKISIDMLFQLKGSAASLIISEIRIEEIPEAIDVQMLDIQTIASGNNLTESEVSVVLVNNSAKSISNFPVQFMVNTGEPVREMITDVIAPYAQYVYTFTAKANLRTSNELGEKFSISAKVLHEADADMTNNWVSTEVHNFANLYTMPYSAWTVDDYTNEKKWNDPKIEKVVEGSLVFTDHMGATGNYQNKGLTTIHFTPATPGKTLQITFRQIELEEDFDFMFIYTDVDGIATPLDDPEPDLAAEITGGMEGMVFVSGAADGGISVSFYSDDMTNAAGWIADIQEIDRTNLFSISMEPLAGYKADGLFDINVTVKNHTPVAANNVNVALLVDGEVVAEETIAQIAANAEVAYTFEAKADLSVIAYHDVEVRILNADADKSDNSAMQRKLNDRYCEISTIAPQNSMYMALVAIEQGEKYSTDANEGYVDYRTTDTLTLYAQSVDVMPLYVGVVDDQVGSKLGVAVDWNDDGTFELVNYADLADGQGKYTLTLENGLQPGAHRMRIGVMPAVQLDACATGDIQLGDVKDFTLKVIDGAYPLQNDLEVAQISDLSGTNLSAAEELQVKITNNSCNVATGFQISYTLNGGEPVTETANISIAPFATEYYTFSTKLDLSAVGVHTIKVSLPADDNLSNNTDSIEVVNIVPEVDGFYALNVGSREEIELGTVGGLSFSSGGTLEALINTQGGSLNTIYEGKEIWLLTTNGDAASWLPENSLVMLIGGGSGIYYTDANIIKPGTWQHIAVTLSPGWLYGVTVKMYIDGQEVNVTKDDEYLFRVDDGSSDPLYLASNLNGMVKSARLWNVARSQSDIQSNMYESVRNATGDLPTGCFAEYMFSEGPGNVITMSGNLMATISSDRTAAGANCIWVDPTDMLSTMYLAEQTEPATRLTADMFGVKINPTVTDLSALEGEAVKAWPMATITYNGNDVTGTQNFDFSSRKIQLDAQMSLMGRHVNRSYDVVVVHDASPAAELLSLTALAASNTGLTADVQVAPISATNSVMLPGVTDLSAVKFVFVVTDTATLHYNGQQYSNANNEVVFDLREPVIFTVRSADGKHSNRYELTAFSNANSINFSLASNAFTYGDAPVAIEATATSGLPVEFASTDNRVATVVNGQLHIVGAGSATITAYQDGGNGYAAAAEVAQNVTVEPKAISINPLVQNITYGDDIPALQFNYVGLVQPQHVLDLQLPNYSLFTAANAAYKQTEHIYIPVGVYTWKPEQTNLGQQGNYTLTANNGTLNVAAGEAYAVTFSVTNGTTPIKGATIVLEALTVDYPVEYTTNAEGKVEIMLTNSLYAYEATAANSNQKSDLFEINGADTIINIVLKPLAHTLNYSAAANGMIYGPATQQVAYGDNGQAVTAVAVAGYHFDKWNDERTDNPRIDTDVQADVNVQAIFAMNTLSLRYAAAAGGRIASGDVEQVVNFGGDGQPVTAEANEGFMFVRWSDGRTDNPRTDTNVQNDVDVEAIFVYGREFMLDLPYTQNFDDNVLPEHWTVVMNEPGKTWDFSAGNAYISTAKYGESANVSLLTPWFNIADIDASDRILVNFDLSQYENYQGFFSVDYRTVDGANWVNIYKIDGMFQSYNGLVNLEIAKSSIASANKLQLSISYADNYGYSVTFDNFEITPSNPPATYNLTYLGGENGGQVSDGTATATKLEFTPNIGENGPQITAVPADGFEFVRWSDGVTTINRQDNVAAYVWPIYRKAAASVSSYALAYTAGEHGRIEGQFYQLVVEGGNGSSVLAVADAGYCFVGWNDGKDVNPRSETNVTADFTVEAMFASIFSKFTYNTSADGGGSLEGDSIQVLTYGTIGTEVTAVPKEGYVFVNWSDGRTDNPRVDTAKGIDYQVEAIFELLRYELAFNVLDANAKALAGATVKVDGQSLTTDAQGNASLYVVPGKYDYTITKTGYLQKTGVVEVHSDTLVKCAIATGLFDNIIESLTAYPNPTVGAVQVELPVVGTATVDVMVYNANGQLLQSVPAQGKVLIDLSNYPAGMYFIRVGNAVAKVMKE